MGGVSGSVNSDEGCSGPTLNLHSTEGCPPASPICWRLDMLTPPRGCPVGLGQLRPRVPRSRPWVTAKVLQGGLCLGPQNLPLPGLRSTECGPDWLSEGQQGGGGAQVRVRWGLAPSGSALDPAAPFSSLLHCSAQTPLQCGFSEGPPTLFSDVLEGGTTLHPFLASPMGLSLGAGASRSA